MPAETPPPRIADALVLVSCAYTSLKTLEEFGLLVRERALYARLWPRFGRVVVVSYGDQTDHRIAATLLPGDGRARADGSAHDRPPVVSCICNDRGLEPGCFLGTVPGLVIGALAGCRSALVLTDQYWGGDVAVCTARALRSVGLRTGLCARGGYHWSWTMAREHGTASARFAQARFLESELCHAADVVVATTPRIVERLTFQHALPPERVRLVPNFILSEHPAGDPAARQPGLVVTAGRLAREKRIDLLLRAAAALPAGVRERVTVRVVGSGPEEAALRSLAAGLPVRVEFAGRLEHGRLLELMGRAAVYAQLSEYEGHPKTVLEAMAMGAPTLVSDGPGIADHVEDGVTGLVTRPDEGEVAAALARLLTDAVAPARLGAAAAERVRSAFSLDTVFPFYHQACADAMATAGAHAHAPASVVRWDPSMLRLPPDAAASTWAGSLHAFARRLEPAAREVFVRGVEVRLEALKESGANGPAALRP